MTNRTALRQLRILEKVDNIERNEMLADLKRKEYEFCDCGALLLTEQEQRDEICRECI